MSDGDPGKADLHVHSAHGDGMAGPQELLDYVEAETDLDVIAVTDHDDIEGALLVREAWARGRYRFELVTGIEVTAIEGHVLALFIEAPVPGLRPLEEVLESVHRQGGLCVIPHPLSWLTRSLGRGTILRVLDGQREGVYFDGLETANQAPGARIGLRKALELNRSRLHLAEVGGSDAHFLKAIGSAYTRFPGHTAEELRRAILARETSGVNGRHPTLLQIGLGQVLAQTWRGLTVTPRKMGWGPTAASFFKRIFHLS
ncbi:MAG TPA: PHP-associated domain-containing protein [Dehalococcoidia bacterium]|nr:PHP-associated domain-containing protein [Dehalococcoidia bacterium]